MAREDLKGAAGRARRVCVEVRTVPQMPERGRTSQRGFRCLVKEKAEWEKVQRRAFGTESEPPSTLTERMIEGGA